MTHVLVQAGTTIVINHIDNTIGTKYPNEQQPRNIYKLNEDWLKEFTVCRVCKQPHDDETLAFAFWKLEPRACSSTCLTQETHKRFACCNKATRTNCVCTYSTTCPDHGERHVGTHD